MAGAPGPHLLELLGEAGGQRFAGAGRCLRHALVFGSHRGQGALQSAICKGMADLIGRSAKLTGEPIEESGDQALGKLCLQGSASRANRLLHVQLHTYGV